MTPLRLPSLALVPLLAFLTAFFLATPALAQVDYELGFDRGSAGEPPLWRVEASFPASGSERVDVWFPRWTAGAYHLADFGRFVDELEAYDPSGEPLDLERISDSQVRVKVGSAERFTLRFEASSISRETFTDGVIDVESNRIAENYAYVTPVSLFPFVPESQGEQITLGVEVPDGWQTATALLRDERGRYRSPNFLHFEDSPLLFSPELHTVEFEVDGKPHSVTAYGRTPEDVELLAQGCERIVDATAELTNGLPYTHYHFLYVFASKQQGASGLEHSFSTLILVPNRIPLADSSESFWSITAHEFFHAWVPERIHVDTLHRPDYTQALETGTIWFNEGVTEYVTQHILLQAGFIDHDHFLSKLAGGRPFPANARSTSWTDVSRAAAAWTEGQRGIMEFATAMYGTGPKVIFALDMEMRRVSDGQRGIIDLIRYLRRAYVDADRGFREGTMIHMINGIAQGDLGELYERYIDGREFPDMARALEVIGYESRGGAIRELEQPSDAQRHAREDFFSIP